MDSKIANFREYAVSMEQNSNFRKQMEDTYFCIPDCLNDKTLSLFGVLDGHGGKDVATYLSKNLPEQFIKDLGQFKEAKPLDYFNNLFTNLNNQLKPLYPSGIGSTSCSVLLKTYQKDSKRQCFIANLGDARAILNFDDTPMRLSIDHKGYNTDEQMRIRRVGGSINRGRLMGQLAVTRAFGDFEYQQFGLSCSPDLKIIELQGKEKYLIIASDGLWDVIDDNVLIQEKNYMIRKQLNLQRIQNQRNKWQMHQQKMLCKIYPKIIQL